MKSSRDIFTCLLRKIIEYVIFNIHHFTDKSIAVRFNNIRDHPANLLKSIRVDQTSFSDPIQNYGRPELSTGDGSLFLDPTRQNFDPTSDGRQKVWPDPTRLDPHMYFISWVQNSSWQQGTIYNIIAWFRGNIGKYFSTGLSMFPEGGKNKLEWSYFSRPWSRGNKTTTNNNK